MYYGSGTNLQGSSIRLQGYALAASQPNSTIVIAVPGRLGLSEAFKNGLLPFSQNGYSVLAVDLYAQVPATLIDGNALETALEEKGLPDIIANLTQAQQFASQHFQSTRIVLVGWDTGGKWAATTALTMQGTFAAVVSYTGDLSVLKQYQPSSIRTPILGIFSVNDTVTSASEMVTMFTQFQKQNAPVTFNIIQDVQGNFMDPASTAYQPISATSVLQLTYTFLSHPTTSTTSSEPSTLTQTGGLPNGGPL